MKDTDLPILTLETQTSNLVCDDCGKLIDTFSSKKDEKYCPYCSFILSCAIPKRLLFPSGE